VTVAPSIVDRRAGESYAGEVDLIMIWINKTKFTPDAINVPPSSRLNCIYLEL
jgi:hypothetical protein